MRVPIAVMYLLVSVIVHVVGARWLLARTPALRSDKRLLALFWVAVAALALTPSFAKAALSRTESGILLELLAVSVLEMFAMGLTVITIALFGLALRLGRRARSAVVTAPAPAPPSPPPDEAVLDRRQALERLAGVGLYGVTAGTFGWGMVRGRLDFALEEVVVKIPGWPRALEGYTIAQVSDLHVGAFIGDDELRRGFELVRRAKPDLVVATGDLVDFVAEAADPLAAHLRSLGARDGAYAIVGNHDHYAGPDEVIARLRKGGIHVLSNEGLVIRGGDGGGFALLGVDDLQGRKRPQPGFHGPDLRRALAGIPDDRPRILLAHQPPFFREVAGHVALQLSGHTHGGQIRPLTQPVTAFWDFVRGRYERDGSTLYVNRGFGTSGPPSRVGSPPEVTRIVIVSG